MAPQPLSNFNRPCGINFNQGEIEQFPERTATTMSVVSTCSSIDQSIANLVSRFLKADYEVVAEMLQAVISAEGRTAAILAAAKHTLPDEDITLFDAVRVATNPSRKKRHAFAHHIWGFSPQIDDALLLMDPKYFIGFSAALANHMQDIYSAPFEIDHTSMPQFDTSKVFVHRKRDLIEAREDANRAYGYFHDLGFILDHKHPARGPMRAQLLNEPPIRQALERLSRKNNQ